MSAIVKGSDETARQIKKQIQETETNTGALNLAMASYLKGQEKLRGKRLEIAVALKTFSESEDSQLKSTLLSTAEAIVDMEEHRKYMHDRLDSKASQPLSQYKGICNTLKTELSAREAAVSKEQKKQQDLDRITVKEAGNRSKITQQQMEVDNATQNLLHVNNALAGHVERFEGRKQEDLQQVIQEMIYSEMNYHAKSLEVLTNLQAQVRNEE